MKLRARRLAELATLPSLKSIRVRLVAISVLIFGAAIIVLTAVLYRGIAETQQLGFDTALHNYAVDVSRGFDVNFLGGLVLKREAILEESKIFPFPLGKSIVQFRTLNGNVLLTSRKFESALPVSQEALNETMSLGFAFESYRLGREDYRIINYLVKQDSLPPLILQIAAPLQLVESERHRILPLIWILIPLALATAAAVGLILSTRALKPVYRIIDSARAIKPNELSARVPVPEETELRELGLTLNELLERLQRAFESQERFIADASHQLKTPLAIIRGELDVFRNVDRSPAEARELLTSVSQEVNQLAKLVDDLLLLARFDSGTWLPTFTLIRLDEVLLETIAQLGRFARAREVALNLDLVTESAVGGAAESATDAYEMKGDADLLKALFFNLIENAIKYAPKPGGIATVRLCSLNSGGLSVAVSDNGPGIPLEDAERVFDRFYRGSRRQHLVAGVGLGLSIANRIAKLHGATLSVSPPGQAVGTTVEFRVPRNP